MLELRNICTQIKDGDWIESKDQSADGIRLIQTGNIGIGTYLDKDNRAKFISEETFNELKCTEVFEGDILISRLPSPVGRACLVPKLDGRAITAVDCTIVSVDRDICIPKYFVYYTMSDKYLNQIDRFVVGTTRARISRKNLEGIKIFLPEISRQKKIVEVLDKAKDLIDKRKKQLDTLDELVKSRFIEMFGDPIKNPKNLEKVYLKDISELITKGSSPNWQGIEYVEDESQTLFVTSENVREGYLDLSKKKYLMDEFNDKQKRSILKNGDFLINIVGASIGRAAQFNLDTKANINQAVALVRIKTGLINDKYLLTYLNSPKALAMYESMKVSVARANLSLKNINELEILLPPIELQNQFADFVNQVDKLKSQMETSLEELEDNFNSLMQKAFKGELF